MRHRSAKPREGCPNCEFTIQHTQFRKELDKELLYLPKSTRRGYILWPSKKMIELVYEAASLSAMTKGRNRRWPVVLSSLISIYRDEIAKKKSIDSYNMRQSVEAAKEKQTQGQRQVVPRGMKNAASTEYD